MKLKYTKELLENIVKNNISVAGVLRDLNLKQTGGNHSHITGKIKKFKIDTSHFLGKKSNFGLSWKGPKRISAQEIFDKKLDYRQKANLLRRAMLEIGILYICNYCKQNNIWNNKKLVLEIDHIDGNWANNNKNNLQFLCPNCHSQK